ncbi:4Fe-4S dicluster domain-containing protein [Maridesulfovibrio zosterae]|uniref:4Fe-4S dicluster domain-containing protein n=1 Tax=Maridesulfovibrio zosterae TaxID=82171 RepID=UPI000427552D|nr:4Fe-4S dicluster domain-containing protein [Maridesulfovibrio zosterae]
MHTFVLSDPERCIGCRSCEIACVAAHMDEDMVEAGNKKLAFSPRIKIIHEAQVTAPIQCRQCEDAPCASVCPVGAIIYDGTAVRINTELCFGCKACLAACPVGAMQVGRIHESSDAPVAHKCDLCSGREDGPACVSVCPSPGALKILTSDELKLIAGKRRRKSALQLAFENK